MNKLFIGLLIVAAGAGAFFFLRNKKQSNEVQVNKELLVGKWKLQSFQAGKDSGKIFLTGITGPIDSNQSKYDYEFTNGDVVRSVGDSVKKTISYYEWKKNQLVWKDDPKDSTGNTLQVSKLNKDSLQLQGDDSTVVLFTKLK